MKTAKRRRSCNDGWLPHNRLCEPAAGQAWSSCGSDDSLSRRTAASPIAAPSAPKRVT